MQTYYIIIFKFQMVKSPKSSKKAAARAAKARETAETNAFLDSIFILISSDGEKFQTDGHCIRHSKVLMQASKSLETPDTPIQVEKVQGDTLNRVLEWCNNHRDDGKYVSQCGPSLRLPQWDFRWLKDLDNQELVDLINASNDLQMQQLMDYACKTVANMAKGKNPAQLRELFGILTDEEEAELALNEPGPSTA